jgi:tetratricopeptide (TPR) repeat protein
MRLTWRACLAALLAAGLLTGCSAMGQRGNTQNDSALPSPGATIKQSAASPSLWQRLSGKSSGQAKAASKEDDALSLAMLRGRNHERAGEWDKAREVYEAVRRQDPERMEAVHRLGVVADSQRRHSEAELLFQEVLTRQPRNAAVLSDLGYCYFLQGQLSKAESALQKAAKLEPKTPRHWNNLGLAIGHQGRYDEALECFRKVGSEADAQFNLAFIYAAQEQTAKAKACFELALAADPLHRRSREALTSFEEYERLPKHLRELDDIAENGVRYVPYVEGSDPTGVEQAGGVATSQEASRAARALFSDARGMLNRNMASQRAEDMAGQP